MQKTIKTVTATSFLRSTLLLFATFLFISASFSQTNQWTWVKGDNTINEAGVYGTQGVADNANKPGARYGFTPWKDASGNFFLFGGIGPSGRFNDLWKYNPTTNQWTWVKGDNILDQPGIYGTQGVANAANKPGARTGSAAWTDASGNFWLFGGEGFDVNGASGTLNDLWKYDPSTNQWTWVKGDNVIDQSGIYGTQGIANAANKPGSRGYSVTGIDASGNLLLFGGVYSTLGVRYNDLWSYNPSTNQWTWLKGDNITDQPGVYGTQGTANSANKPGARFGSASWTDASGNFWVFGGSGFDVNSALGTLNDLWKYDPSINQWTWVKGDNIVGQPGV